MKKVIALAALSTGIGLLFFGFSKPATPPPAKRPNVIIIYTDD